MNSTIYKGGSINIDCAGLDIDNLGTVNGLYNRMYEAYNINKSVNLLNIVNGTIAYTPIKSGLSYDGTYVAFDILGQQYQVSSSDVVSIVE